MFGVRRVSTPGAQLVPATAGRPGHRRSGGHDRAHRASVLLRQHRVWQEDLRRTGQWAYHPVRSAHDHNAAAGDRSGVRPGRPGRLQAVELARDPGRTDDPDSRDPHGTRADAGHSQGARCRRLRVATQACLRHRADRHAHAPASRRATRSHRRDPGRLADRPPRGRGDLSGSRRCLRRRGEPGGTRGDPGGRPVAPVAQPRRRRRDRRDRPPRRPGRTSPGCRAVHRGDATTRSRPATDPTTRHAAQHTYPRALRHRSRTCCNVACPVRPSPTTCDSIGKPCAGSPTPPASTSFLSISADATRSSTRSSPTCTSDGTRAAPTPPCSTKRSANAASPAATRPSAVTCARSGPPPPRHPCPPPPPRPATSPAGS